MDELRAHRQPEPVAQLGGLPPADVRQRLGRLPERREEIPGVARVVGDDRLGGVDHLGHLVDHAVGVDRRLVGGELRTPLVEPLFTNFLDLAGHVVEPAAIAVQSVVDGVDQRLEREAGVADQRVLGVDVLVDIGGIERRVDDRLVLGLGEGEPVGGVGEATADPEDDVGLAHEVGELAGLALARGAQRERVVLGERALAVEAGRHRRLEALRELLEGVPALRVVDALAREDHGTFGLEEHVGDLLDALGVGARAVRRGGLVVELALEVHPEHVLGDLDQRRLWAAVSRRAERAAHRFPDGLGVGELLTGLGDVLVVDQRVELGLDVGLRLVVARRDRDHRRRLAVGLGDPTERVLGAGTVLAGEPRDLVARGQPADRVGHVGGGSLLAGDDRPDPRLLGRARVEQRVAREAEQVLYPFLLQRVRDGVVDVHGRYPNGGRRPPLR